MGIQNLRVTTARSTLVHEVSLVVAPGAIHCLVGNSGSGKTLTSLASVGLLPNGLRAHGTIRLADQQHNLLDLDSPLSCRGQVANITSRLGTAR